MIHKGTKNIQTDRLILRPFRVGDVKAMYDNWTSDDEVTKYLMWPTHKEISITENVLKEWIANYENMSYYQWAIVLKEYEDEPIGCIGVVNSINETIQKAHIGYCIGRKWWNKGITSEAMSCVIKYLFEEVGVHRIESRFDPRNIGSGVVMKKCGMKYEGTLRKADWNNQGICDASYYGLLAEEYKAQVIDNRRENNSCTDKTIDFTTIYRK